MVITGILMMAIAVGSAAFSFFMWALALNGFMGQERAVNISLITFVILMIVFALVSITLSVFAVRYLAVMREWNAAVSAAISMAAFTVVLIVLDLLSIFVSVLVASGLRTSR